MVVRLQFRAGQMEYLDKLLRADNRKGLIRVFQDDQGLTHFQWLLRDSSEVEKDIILFPQEAIFEKVCTEILQINRPGARVFVLKFKDEPERNLFFWSQEPDLSDDDKYAAAVDSAINLELPDEDMGVSGEEQIVHLEHAQAPARTAEQAADELGTGNTGGGIQADQLASILSNLIGSSAPPLPDQRAMAVGPSLGDILKPELITPLLQSPDIINRLLPYLPEEQRSEEGIMQVVASPHFRHQLAVFSHALMSGQLDLTQFGLQGQGYGVLEFLRALQQQVDDESQKDANVPS